MMDRRTENMFQNKRFFLEIKNSPHLLLTLTKNIKQLGGLIESFLNKNVNYVVTNRPKAEWPQKAEPQSATAAKISSNQQFALSRASKMLQSTQNVPKTTDPLEMARKFDKKIIFANDLLEFLKKYSSGTQAEADKAHCTGEMNHRKLIPPYIKVVDKTNRFKTNFKELPEWPEINFDYQPELCPFYKPRKFNPSQTSNKSAVILGKPNDRFQTVLTTPIMTTPTLNINQIRSIPTKNASTKRKHLVFCEICHKEYDDLEKHLNDETHSTFLNTENNFTELLSVINSLPPFIATPAKVMRTSLNSNKSITDISNIMSRENTSTFMPPPNDPQIGRKIASPEMLSIHSINKWESKNGHGFMALHNLVNDENGIN